MPQKIVAQTDSAQLQLQSAAHFGIVASRHQRSRPGFTPASSTLFDAQAVVTYWKMLQSMHVLKQDPPLNVMLLYQKGSVVPTCGNSSRLQASSATLVAMG